MALTCARNHCGPLAAASPHNLSKVSCQITVVYFPYLSKGNVSYLTSPMDSKGRAEPRSQGEDWKKRDPGNEVGQLRKRHYLITLLLQLKLGLYYSQHDLNCLLNNFVYGPYWSGNRSSSNWVNQAAVRFGHFLFLHLRFYPLLR